MHEGPAFLYADRLRIHGLATKNTVSLTGSRCNQIIWSHWPQESTHTYTHKHTYTQKQLVKATVKATCSTH